MRSGAKQALPQPLPQAGGGIRFAGYASVFDRVDRGGDVVRAGAFAASLKEGRAVPLLWQHRPGAVIGTIEALAEDARGLRVVARVTHPTAAALIARGALTGLSFGYRVRGARGENPRELTALDLAEVSLVAAPMQPLARVVAVESGLFLPAPKAWGGGSPQG
ncbi:HK97 family phage prohead protease [Sphingopyxis sp. SE2]|nr:HK97 family phage prohead protease [Sphingopyxis sp. SE2]MDT7529413.1 HK97 family phage prohead protease [Sphingopyxis sp. SE2]